jgi:hypothetical protein
VLAQIGEDEVGGDRRRLIDAGLAPLALHIVFLGEAEPAVRLHRRLGGVPGGLGGEQLGHVGIGAARLAGLEQRGGPARHHVGGLQLGVGAGERELHALVLADRAPEHPALVGVGHALVEQPASVTDALGGDQDALRIHAVEDVAEALALLADQVLGRNLEIVEEHLGGVVVDEGLDRPDLQAMPARLAQVDDEGREPFRALFHLVCRRRACQQQHQIGVQGA